MTEKIDKVRVIVPAVEFVKTWQSSETPNEVASKLNMNIKTVMQRANTLIKKHNIPLKSMSLVSQRGRKTNWEELAKVCTEYQPSN